jgi:ABC-2 type transport system permease protein
MTTLTEVTPVPAAAEQGVAAAASRRVVPPIPLGTVIGVELRKMFDTRSGFWMLASIGILAVLATGAVILFASDSELTYSTFASAIGFPMAIVLPMIAILSVTGEWSQRSGLTTFTLVPHRGRVVFAKAVGAVGVGVVSMVAAMLIGALGNVVGTAIAGVPTTWNVSATELLYIVLANVLGLLMGFTLGVLIRNSAGAIVAYFVYSLALPTVTGLLAAAQGWFRDLQPWVDFQYNQTGLFGSTGLTGEQWAQLGVTGALWLLLPMVLGVWLVLRSEVK